MDDNNENHSVYLIYYKNVPVYVGSSMDTKERFKEHKWNILNKNKRKIFQFINTCKVKV